MVGIEALLALWTHELTGFAEALNGEYAELFEGVLVYSFAISIVWSISGLASHMRETMRRNVPLSGDVPDYTVMIPFHGEATAALRSAWSLAEVSPQPKAILLVDDGSAEPLPASAKLPPSARVISMPQRRGKAGALQAAYGEADTDIIVCLDADTLARTPDWSRMLNRFCDPHVGAVAGKIWGVSNGSLIGKMQEIDYIAVITLIKAAETLWGGLLTVSGAFVAFRKSALLSVGGWSTDKAAEDIDLSWRLQMAGWRVAFDDAWTAGVEMAPTLPALWRQRRRWSSGLGQALYDHGFSVVTSGARHLPSVIVTLANAAWILLMLVLAAVAIWDIVFEPPVSFAASLQSFDLARIALFGLVLFGLQFFVATLVDGRSWKTYVLLLPFLPLYPLYFWAVLCTSFLFGFSRGLLRRDLGIWQPTVRTSLLGRHRP